MGTLTLTISITITLSFFLYLTLSLTPTLTLSLARSWYNPDSDLEYPSPLDKWESSRMPAKSYLKVPFDEKDQAKESGKSKKLGLGLEVRVNEIMKSNLILSTIVMLIRYRRLC
jgi:hypothetical protein